MADITVSNITETGASFTYTGEELIYPIRWFECNGQSSSKSRMLTSWSISGLSKGTTYTVKYYGANSTSGTATTLGTATFTTKYYYKVTIQAGGGISSVSPSGTVNVNKGSSQYITCTLNSNGWGNWSEASTTTYEYRNYYTYSFSTWSRTAGSGSFSSATSQSTYYTPSSDSSTIRAAAISTVTNSEYRYVVRYNANGGSGSMEATRSSSGSSSTGNKSITISSNSFTRTDYTFTGWNTKADGTGTTYESGRNSVPSSLTLYAQWQHNDIIATFASGAGGSIGTTSKAFPYNSYYHEYGSGNHNIVFATSSTTSWMTNIQPDTGYEFDKWTLSTGTLPGYLTSARTFTVSWKAKTITITYHYNDGSGDTNSQSYTYTGGNITLTSWKPTRSGYTFKGWATTSTGSASYQPSQTVPQWSSNVSLYAVWKRNVDKFYWHGISDADDANYIYQGAPITNLTATMWNSINNRIVLLGNLEGQAWPDYPGKSSGDAITASDFNLARNRINLLTSHGTLPPIVSTGNQILASYFNGNSSLKKALNDAIDWWMNN